VDTAEQDEDTVEAEEDMVEAEEDIDTVEAEQEDMVEAEEDKNKGELSWKADKTVLYLVLQSFGFKGGVPEPAAPAARFNLQKLPNPSHRLRHGRTGLDKELQREFFDIPQVQGALERFKTEMSNTLSNHELSAAQEDNVIVIQFGCLHGKHRSVAIVEYLSRERWHLQTDKWSSIEVKTKHRDIDLNSSNSSNRREKVNKRRNQRAVKYSYY